MAESPYPVVVSSSPAVSNTGTVLRYGLTALGGALLVSRGLINDQQLSDLVSAAMIVIPLVWGVVRNHLNQRKMRDMAVAAPDAVAQVK